MTVNQDAKEKKAKGTKVKQPRIMSCPDCSTVETITVDGIEHEVVFSGRRDCPTCGGRIFLKSR